MFAFPLDDCWNVHRDKENKELDQKQRHQRKRNENGLHSMLIDERETLRGVLA